MSTVGDAMATEAVNGSSSQREYLNNRGVARTPNVGPNHGYSVGKLRGPGILSVKAAHGRGLPDTR